MSAPFNDELGGLTPSIDPRDLRQPGGHRSALLPGVAPALRMWLLARTLELLVEHPNARAADVARLAFELWFRVREIRWDGGGRVCEDFAHNPELQSPTYALGELLRVVLEAGDVRANLRARRDALTAQLAVLDRAFDAFALHCTSPAGRPHNPEDTHDDEKHRS